MSTVDRVSALIESLLAPLTLSLYDVELNGGTLRVTVDAPGGVNLDNLAEATRVISRTLDDEDPIPGTYTLEVSSPGVERKLRTPEHFSGAVGEAISVKLAPHVDGERRIRGSLVSATATAIVVATDDGDVDIDLADVTKATTVFDWEPAPKPGSPEARQAARAAAQAKYNQTPDSDRKAATR